MLYIRFLFFLAITFSAFSCKTKGGPVKTEKVTEENYAVVISFISIGSGIDASAYDTITKFIENHPKKPAIEKYQWGREGEMDICLKLSELSTKEQRTFIDELQNIVGKSSLVRISENTPCVHKK